MPLKVVWFSTSSGKSSGCDPAEVAAYNFLLALKGARILGEYLIPVVGEHRRLNASNSDDAIDWFGEMVSAYLQRQSISPPFSLVPLPNAEITLESSRPPWTSLLTMAIASRIEGDVDILDLLRWRDGWQEKEMDAQGPDSLYGNLALTRKTQPGRPVILIGYLARSAATVQACAAALRSSAQVLLAAFAGRIVDQSPKEPFAVMRAEVPDFTPQEPG